MNKKLIRLTESDLHRIIKESVQRILKENDGSYRGVYIQGLGLPEKIVMSKVDACIEKGWPLDDIQRAIDDWARTLNTDYNYKW